MLPTLKVHMAVDFVTGGILHNSVGICIPRLVLEA